MVDKLLKNRGGLHNRITGALYLQQFTLNECEEFFQASGVVMSRYQMIEAYMIFGGVPHYLNLLAPQFSLPQNVDRLCFREGAVLRDELSSLYHSLFEPADNHILVVTALSSKARGLTRAELIEATDLTNGGGMTKVLQDLMHSGFVRKYHAVGKKSRDAVYQLVDFFTLFYLRFMSDQSTRDQNYWLNFSPTPSHTAWSGYAFEMVALLHVDQIRRALGIAGVLVDYAAWSGEINGSKAQVDLVLDRADHVINLCEMKYTAENLAVDAALERQLLRRKAVFTAATKMKKAVHWTLVTTYAPERTAYTGVFQSIVTADDLFAPTL
jgi:hypothetical protein